VELIKSITELYGNEARMTRPANKKFKEAVQKHLKNLQKEDSGITLILVDGNPRSERDLHEDSFQYSEDPDDYKIPKDTKPKE